MTNEDNHCFFCGAEEIILPRVGIAFGMGGSDYSFCRKCLDNMTATEFWSRMIMHLGYKWPPKLTDYNKS